MTGVEDEWEMKQPEGSIVDAIAKVVSHVVCDIEFEGRVILTWPMQSVPLPGDRIETPHHEAVVVKARYWRTNRLVTLICEKKAPG